jgi:tripartite-type tricarboxylate transporter receptor subunit TctC
MLNRRVPSHLLRFGLLLLGLVVADRMSESRADPFPATNTIRIVAPTGAGAPPDVIGRLIANELSDSDGWRVVVENRPGALQTIAMADVLKQNADGLSIFPLSMGVMATPSLLPDKGIRLETDFMPVVKIAFGHLVLVVHPSVPATSVAELVAVIKAQPDKFNFSSGGFGTPGHLVGEMFKLQTGTRATHVPYPQVQQRISDFLSGISQFSFFNISAVADLIATGRLRALAVTAPKRIAALKDVPTVAEQGFPDLLMEDWIGFAVKSGSPAEAVTRINSSVNKALRTQKVRDAIAGIGYEPAGGTPDEFGAFVASQMTHWTKVVKDSGLKMPQ